MVKAASVFLLFAAVFQLVAGQEADLWLEDIDTNLPGGDNEASETRAVAEPHNEAPRDGGGRSEEASPPPPAADAVLTGALTTLIDHEAASDQKLRSEKTEDVTLLHQTRDLQKRLRTAEANDVKLKKLADLADAAARSEHATYEQKYANLAGQYNAKIAVVERRTNAFRKLRAQANATATKARRQLLQERRQRGALKNVAVHLKHKLNKTGEALEVSRKLLRRMRKATESEAEALNVSKAELADATRTETTLNMELGSTQEHLASKNTELKSLERQWIKDSGAMHAAYEGAARAARAATKNATQEALELRAAGQAHELLSSNAEARLKKIQIALAASEQQSEAQMQEFSKIKENANVTRVLLEQQGAQANRRSKEFQAREEREAEELSAAKAQLAAGHLALNTTKTDLASSSAVLANVSAMAAAERAQHVAFVKTSQDHKEKQDLLLDEARKELAKESKAFDDERAEVSARADELNMTHHELSTALELVKSDKETRAKLSKTAVTLEGAAEKTIGNLHAKLSILHEEMMAAKEALSAKEKELSGVQEGLGEATGKAEVLDNQLSVADAKAKDAALKQEQKVRTAQASAKDETAKGAELEADLRAQNTKLKEVEGSADALRSQIQASSADAAKQSSVRRALQAEVRRLESATVSYRKEAQQAVLTVQNDEWAKSGEVKSTQAKLGQVESEVQALIVERASEEKALRAERSEQQALAKARATQLQDAEANANEQSVARNRLADAVKEANTQVTQLKATHTALANELGVTLEEFQSGAVQELHEFRAMHERLTQADDELHAARRELGVKSEEIEQSQAQLNATRRYASGAGAIASRLSTANVALGEFRRLLAAKDAELNQTKISLVAATAQANELKGLQAKLDAAEEEVVNVHAGLAREARELNATRERLTATQKTASDMKFDKDLVIQKLAVLSKRLNITHTELSAEAGELNFTRKQLTATLAAADHLHEMRTRLGAAGKELKAYQEALGAQTHKLNATKSELSAAMGRRAATVKAASAEIKELDEVQAKLHVEGVQLVSMGSRLGEKGRELDEVKRDIAVKDQSLRIEQAQLSTETSQVRQVNATRNKIAMLKMAETAKLSELSSKIRTEHQELLSVKAGAENAAKASAQELKAARAKVQAVAYMAEKDLGAKDKQASSFLAQKDQALKDMKAKLAVEGQEMERAQIALNTKKDALQGAQAQAKRSEQTFLEERVEANTAATENSRLQSAITEVASKEKEVAARTKQLEVALAAVNAKADADAFAQKSASRMRVKQLEAALAAANARAGASEESGQKEGDELADQTAALTHVKAALNARRVGNNHLRTRTVGANTAAQTLGQQVSQARQLLAQDAELLRHSREKQAALTEQVSVKYNDLKHQFEGASHDEQDLAAQNHALKAEMVKLRAHQRR